MNSHELRRQARLGSGYDSIFTESPPKRKHFSVRKCPPRIPHTPTPLPCSHQGHVGARRCLCHTAGHRTCLLRNTTSLSSSTSSPVVRVTVVVHHVKAAGGDGSSAEPGWQCVGKYIKATVTGCP